MKELKIGEIGVIDGVKVLCIESYNGEDDCKRCALNTPRHIHDTGMDYFYECTGGTSHKCCKTNRSDHTDVYFKKIEE